MSQNPENFVDDDEPEPTRRWIAGGHNHPGTTLPSNVTGDCPHKHRSPEAAQKCIERHDAAIKRGHGRNAYSDRVVIELDAYGHKIRPDR